MKIWKDGELQILSPEEEALFDPSRPENFGVFETLRTYGEHLFKPEEHLLRLQQSAKLLGFELPFSLEKIQSFLQQSVDENTEPRPLKIKCVATQQHVFVHSVHLNLDPSLQAGVSTISVPLDRLNPKAKALPYSASFEAHSLAEQHGAYEAILVDEEGFVTEGAYSNIFWVEAGQLCTRNDQVLEGITRSVILELFSVTYKKVTLEELKTKQEIFLTKTTTGPIPIVKIDDALIGPGHPGPLTQIVMQRFKEVTDEGRKA